MFYKNRFMNNVKSDYEDDDLEFDEMMDYFDELDEEEKEEDFEEDEEF